MIRTQIMPCRWNKSLCDRLNMESGTVYSRVAIEHWRRYRRHAVWLSHFAARRIDDMLSQDWDHILSSNCIDNAQEGFFGAIKTARTLRKSDAQARFPYKRKRFRPTVWNGEANVRHEDGRLRLSTARYHESLYHQIPDSLGDIKEARLVYQGTKYMLHLVCDDGKEPADRPGDGIMALDMGEIHPAVSFDGEVATIFSCRALRSNTQYRHKRLAELSRQQSRRKRGSSRRRRLADRKRRFLFESDMRQRDMLHKLSRAIVDHAVERKVGTLVIGDLKDIADGKRLSRRSQQKVSSWPRGKLESYIEYKAKEVGIALIRISERGTSSHCPRCGDRVKPRGRTFVCSACGFREHRDVVGAMNIYHMYRSSPDTGYERSPQAPGQVARRDDPDSNYGWTASDANPVLRVVRPWLA